MKLFSQAVLERMIYDLIGIQEKESKAIQSKQATSIQGGRQISMFDVRNTA
jgi:hypothetical protein